MLSALSWLLGCKSGRITTAIILACASVALAFRQAYQAGAEAEKSRQIQANLDVLRFRISTDEKITKMSISDRRRELTRWVQRDTSNE